MTPPVIGICVNYETTRWGERWEQLAAMVPITYIEKIRAAGGVPIALIPDRQAIADPHLLLDRIDGLLLIGGADVDPAAYQADRSPLTEETVPERDAFEIALAAAAFAADLPLLGICRGLQLLNVAAGGTLHQHLPAAGYADHRPHPGSLQEAHHVTVDADTLAAQIAGPGSQLVNSHHHQGVDQLGRGAVVTARSEPDQLPEALEWPASRYALGVQWHPEADELDHALTNFVRAAG